MIEADALLLEIRKYFFQERRFRKEEILLRAPSYDDTEKEATAEFFSNKSNAEVSYKDLVFVYPHQYEVCLGFMPPNIAAYFLGAYMCFAVAEADKSIQFSLMNILEESMWDSREDKSWIQKFRSSFSTEQKEVIRNFVSFIHDKFSMDMTIMDFDRAVQNYS